MATEFGARGTVSFFYHLGDIVYLNGERSNYGAQFFDPYEPIARRSSRSRATTMETSRRRATPRRWTRSSSSSAQAPRAIARRTAAPSQRQPNVYWTLEHEWVTIIGLYSGVPEGGVNRRAAARWLAGELNAARRGVVADTGDAPSGVFRRPHARLKPRTARHARRCFERAGRAPDAVFSAHAHNYQRFTRVHEGRQIPYVVAGSGGFHELHGLGYGVPDTPASFAALPDLTLEAHQHQAFGFITVTCGPGRATVAYNTVVRRRPAPFDSFEIRPAG